MKNNPQVSAGSLLVKIRWDKTPKRKRKEWSADMHRRKAEKRAKMPVDNPVK